jgi:hypothetical protein
MKTNINYLKKAQHVQEIVIQEQKTNEYITLKAIWRKLRRENLYFEGYGSFIRILGEGNLTRRIEEQKEKINQICGQ